MAQSSCLDFPLAAASSCLPPRHLPKCL